FSEEQVLTSSAIAARQESSLTPTLVMRPPKTAADTDASCASAIDTHSARADGPALTASFHPLTPIFRRQKRLLCEVVVQTLRDGLCQTRVAVSKQRTLAFPRRKAPRSWFDRVHARSQICQPLTRLAFSATCAGGVLHNSTAVDIFDVSNSIFVLVECSIVLMNRDVHSFGCHLHLFNEALELAVHPACASL